MMKVILKVIAKVFVNVIATLAVAVGTTWLVASGIVNNQEIYDHAKRAFGKEKE